MEPLHHLVRHAKALADVLNSLLASPERVQLAKVAALAAAQKTFCWEREEGVLLDAVMHALERTRVASQVLGPHALATESGAEAKA